jgi:D-alanyl-D-alanine carboxypeptidase (penicillin-binding protein 5/6)
MRLVHIPPKTIVRKKRRWKRYVRVLCLVFAVLLAVNYVRPLPSPTIALDLPAVPAPSPNSAAWPASGMAALATSEHGVVATHNGTQPIATASIAKVITALCVLEKYPLQPGDAGPLLVIGPADVGFYQQQLAQNGSNLPVYEGERLSLYQALQALMIPSANNIADSLALWAFGSSQGYATYANAYAARNGLTQTRVGSDASGLDPSTTSTANDLAQLGLLAMKQPVLMEIAGQTSAVFPYAGELRNYNRALGKAGIDGLKTGNNEQNPGGLLFTAKTIVAGHTIHLAGTVLGAASLPEALGQSEALAASAAQNFEHITYLQKGQPVGIVRTAWGASAPVVAEHAVELVRWKGTPLVKQQTLTTPYASNAAVATVNLRTNTVHAGTSLKLAHAPSSPSIWWRLTRTH